MFETLSEAPRDAILGLTEAFQADPNPEKINLAVGVYQDATGTTPILSAVKRAEERLLAEESSKGYLGIAGAPRFAAQMQELLFGAESKTVRENRARTSHTPGGTGALRVAGNFLREHYPQAKVWLSEPTWPNHPKVFAAAGLQLETYPYYDAPAKALDFDRLRAGLEQIPSGDVVVLHACCHNPTGVDPSPDQWNQVARIVRDRGLLPLVDFAYQGFGSGLEEDRVGLEALAQLCPELILCSSLSKNFGLYRERVGALTFVASDSAAADIVQSQVKAGIRANYSNPPAHGAAIATTILDDSELRELWHGELAAMRDRINGIRRLLVEKLTEQGVPGDFSFITRQRGMFSFSGLTAEQVGRLQEEHSIYIVGSGRINVAGITEANIDRLCAAIANVAK